MELEFGSEILFPGKTNNVGAKETKVPEESRLRFQPRSVNAHHGACEGLYGFGDIVYDRRCGELIQPLLPAYTMAHTRIGQMASGFV